MSDVDWERARHEIEHAGEPTAAGRAPRIDPEKAPGRLVVQVWCNGEVLDESPVERDEIGVEALQAHEGEVAAAALRSGWTVELRIHDGDSGAWIFSRRMTPPG